MINNPLDKTRTNQSQAIERGDQCYSIIIHGSVSAVLPYSYLQGAVLEENKLFLLHQMAIAEIAGPPEALAEILELVSQQRLAVVRQGFDSLVVNLSLTTEATAKHEEI